MGNQNNRKTLQNKENHPDLLPNIQLKRNQTPAVKQPQPHLLNNTLFSVTSSDIQAPTVTTQEVSPKPVPARTSKPDITITESVLIEEFKRPKEVQRPATAVYAQQKQMTNQQYQQYYQQQAYFQQNPQAYYNTGNDPYFRNSYQQAHLPQHYPDQNNLPPGMYYAYQLNKYNQMEMVLVNGNLAPLAHNYVSPKEMDQILK